MPRRIPLSIPYLEVAALVLVEETETACFHQLANYLQGRLVVPLVHLPVAKRVGTTKNKLRIGLAIVNNAVVNQTVRPAEKWCS